MSREIKQYVLDNKLAEVETFDAFMDGVIQAANNGLGDLHSNKGTTVSTFNTGYNKELWVASRSNIEYQVDLMSAIANKAKVTLEYRKDSKGSFSLVEHQSIHMVPSIMIDMKIERSYKTFMKSVIDRVNAKLESLPKPLIKLDSKLKDIKYRTRIKQNAYNTELNMQDIIVLFDALVTEIYEVANDERYKRAVVELAEGYTDPGSPSNPNVIVTIKHY